MSRLGAQQFDDLGPASPAPAAAERRRRARQNSRIASGIFAAGSTRSTAPVRIALRGMPSNPASSGSCAITSPPFSLIAFSPELPSAPVPERTTQMAREEKFLRQRMQQEIERQARAVTLLRLRKPQGAGLDREIGARRNDIEMFALDRHAVGRLTDFHRRMAGKQLHQHAFMGRIEVLDQNGGEAGAGGSASSTILQASSPPAEAPIATTENASDSLAAAGSADGEPARAFRRDLSRGRDGPRMRKDSPKLARAAGTQRLYH